MTLFTAHHLHYHSLPHLFPELILIYYIFHLYLEYFLSFSKSTIDNLSCSSSLQISCEDEKTIFKLALDQIKDTLVVMLNNRNELPHFWFHETLFKPFEKILLSGTINEVEQEEVWSYSNITEVHN